MHDIHKSINILLKQFVLNHSTNHNQTFERKRRQVTF